MFSTRYFGIPAQQNVGSVAFRRGLRSFFKGLRWPIHEMQHYVAAGAIEPALPEYFYPVSVHDRSPLK